MRSPDVDKHSYTYLTDDCGFSPIAVQLALRIFPNNREEALNYLIQEQQKTKKNIIDLTQDDDEDSSKVSNVIDLTGEDDVTYVPSFVPSGSEKDEVVSVAPPRPPPPRLPRPTDAADANEERTRAKS